MATPAEAVRAELADVSAAATEELTYAVGRVAPDRRVGTVLDRLPIVVPAYYDATGALAVAWYDEVRAESNPSSVYAPSIIGNPETDWIEREVATFRKALGSDLAVKVASAKIMAEVVRLAEKEVLRGFRDSITGNAHMDPDAIGWSRVARAGACKFCVMLAGRGAVFRQETASFAAHSGCNCSARPEFRNGSHGPEASAMQYIASSKRRTPAQRGQLRSYLNEHYPGAPG